MEKAKQKKKKKGGLEIFKVNLNIFLSSRARRPEDFVKLSVISTTASQIVKNLSLFHALCAFSSSRNRDRGLAQVVEDVPV